jgi:predicted DCC family thiol-disulfide oxidoreductase YuxK
VRRREPVHVIYDGQCDFCVRALRLARAVDVWGRLRFHDAHDRQAVERAFPALAGADLDEAMYAVTAEGAGSGLVGPWIYAWIAKNRHRFGCRSQIWALPEANGPTAAAGDSRPDRT